VRNLLWFLSWCLTLAAIVDIFRSARDWATKAVLVVIVFVPFVGAGLYFLALRDRRPV
jgi:diacylglycerol kinase